MLVEVNIDVEDSCLCNPSLSPLAVVAKVNIDVEDSCPL